MAKHAAPAARSPWRPFALALVASLLLAGTGSGVLALFRAVATTTQTASTGTLALTVTGNGAFGTTAITDAAPGDTVHRYVTLQNTGSLEATNLTLAVSSNASILANGSTTSLQLSVTECSVAWVPTTGACGGTTSTAPATTGVVLPLAAAALPGTVFGGGKQRHLRLALTVPNTTETVVDGVIPATSVLGKSATLTFTFTGDQRTAAVSSS